MSCPSGNGHCINKQKVLCSSVEQLLHVCNFVNTNKEFLLRNLSAEELVLADAAQVRGAFFYLWFNSDQS